MAAGQQIELALSTLLGHTVSWKAGARRLLLTIRSSGWRGQLFNHSVGAEPH
jgi:hypothetical protein